MMKGFTDWGKSNDGDKRLLLSKTKLERKNSGERHIKHFIERFVKAHSFISFLSF